MDTVFAPLPFPLRPGLGGGGDRPSRWITRERPRIDRFARPWLVLRFIDSMASVEGEKT